MAYLIKRSLLFFLLPFSLNVFAQTTARDFRAVDEYVQKLNGNTAFAVIPFDRRAATECSFLLADAWDKKVQKGVTRTKFKFDWMIVACAASRNIKLIYSDDADIARCAEQRDIKVIMQNTLKVPEESRQGRIPGVD